jgi:hypothetical protein
MVFQELHEVKQISFPSKFRKEIPKSPEQDPQSKKKSVSFSMEKSDAESSTKSSDF